MIGYYFPCDQAQCFPGRKGTLCTSTWGYTVEFFQYMNFLRLCTKKFEFAALYSRPFVALLVNCIAFLVTPDQSWWM